MSPIGANLENLILSGTAAINARGNALDNRITGNSANNFINGYGGADVLSGRAGNDTYVTDGGDSILEALNGGLDTVSSSATHPLGANLENLILTGSAAIDGTGGNQSFSATIIAAFTGVAGQLAFSTASDVGYLSGDVNGDKIADFSIRLANDAALSASSLIL